MQRELLPVPKRALLLLSIMLISFSVNMQGINANEPLTACELLLARCSEVVEKQKETIESQKTALEKQDKVIETQEKIINEQDKEITRLEDREDTVTWTASSIIGALLLVILL